MKQFRKMTIPYIVWMSVMIVIPMLFIFMYGITKEGNSVVTLNFTLDNFAKFFVEPIYIDADPFNADCRSDNLLLYPAWLSGGLCDLTLQ